MLHRYLILLSLINACLMSIVFVFVFLASILSKEIAPEAGWSTIPITSFVVGAAAFVIPISMLMEARGRKSGFLLGAVLGCLAGLSIYLAGNFDSFAAICLAGFFIGGSTASAGFLRFAGLELSKPENHGKAASIVLCGGIIASFFATRLPLLIEDVARVELFDALAVSVLALSAAALVLMLFLPKIYSGNRSDRELPRPAILDVSLFKQARFRQGVAACAGGYAVMVLLMNATPLHVTDILGFPIKTTEKVMRSHFVAMFVPFLFSGILLDRFGANSLAISGIALNAISVVTLLSGSSEAHLHGALIALGIGWNFLFLSGTTILQSSLDRDRLHVGQRMSELVLGGGNACASALSGALIYALGLFPLLVIASMVCVVILVFFKPYGSVYQR